jgi:hypothetical protein
MRDVKDEDKLEQKESMKNYDSHSSYLSIYSNTTG